MYKICPNCNKITYDEYICDFCNYEIKKDKTYNFKPNSKNKISGYTQNNRLITIAIVVIAISVSYLAISKFTEDTPQEKLLKSLYGTADEKEIENINEEIVKESEKAFIKAGEEEIKMFKNFLDNSNPMNK